MDNIPHHISFVPKRLSYDDFPMHHKYMTVFPERMLFPVNVLYGLVAASITGPVMVSAMHVPQFDTFRHRKRGTSMLYYNEQDPRFWTLIVIGGDMKLEGKKYCGKRLLSHSIGSQWEVFFHHLTMAGPAYEEKFTVDPLHP